MKSSDDSAELRDLIARVSRQVARRTGHAGVRADLAQIVAAEVTAALAASTPAAKARPTTTPTPTDLALSEAARVCASCIEQERRKTGRRAVVTSTGKNRKGIVAKIAQAIADAGGDILDISQTLVADYFTMIIIIDMTSLEVPFTELKTRLTEMVRALGAECLVMHEDVVGALQRI
ncbi:MAG TPA: ACT domain-containing protein [Polyangia bacterium]|jgi:ACT domain-containing protein|nr:ACT domain-containing protein [Polyangia bacterium]